jgi:hypothetical protein
MKLGLALLLALAPGCAATPDPGGNVAVVWHRVEEPHQVCEGLAGRKNFFRIQGCSHWQAPAAEGAPRVCRIYAPAPRNERDLQRFATLGHELLHCFEGNWHDRWGRMLEKEMIGRNEEGAAASRAPVLPDTSQAAIKP